jgi:hypothetical protein
MTNSPDQLSLSQLDAWEAAMHQAFDTLPARERRAARAAMEDQGRSTRAMVARLTAALPNLAPAIATADSGWVSGGAFGLYSAVLMPAFERLVRDDRTAELSAIAGFLEDLITDDDGRTRNLAANLLKLIAYVWPERSRERARDELGPACRVELARYDAARRIFSRSRGGPEPSGPA